MSMGKTVGKEDAPFRSSKVLNVAKEVLGRGPVCDHCLGRQAAHVSTGMTNLARGELIRKILGAPPEKERCGVCGDVFDQLERYAENAAGLLRKREYSTFAVGTQMSHKLIASEESLWEDVGIEYTEPLKSELNRELGKVLFEKVKKEVDETAPDIVVVLNLEKDRVELRVSPIFIRGGYKKLVRGIPQTKWDKYDETVEDIIAAPAMREAGGSGHSMHAAGREDIDARCLDWRPFVLEISEPVKRKIGLIEMKNEINRSKKVEVSGLRFSDRKGVVEVKSMRGDKEYLVVVRFSKPVKKADMERVEKILGYISQRTPERVAHRRADKVRKRKVKGISWKGINNKRFEFQIKGEAGLYVKELVTGDNGRTRPSISEVLSNPAVVVSLDVVKIWEK